MGAYRDRVEQERAAERLREAQAAVRAAAGPGIPMPFPISMIPDNRWLDMAIALYVTGKCASFDAAIDDANDCRMVFLKRVEEEKKKAQQPANETSPGIVLPND